MPSSETDPGSVFRFKEAEYDFSQRTYIMGVLNVTPDSFSDGGSFVDSERAVDHALHMIEQGADFIDIGGESTRPGSDPVPLKTELDRVLPVILRLVPNVRIPISIDTYKSEVAREALGAGASMVNDISGLAFDPKMTGVVSEHRASVVIMHMKGTPKNMQRDPVYKDVVGEVTAFLRRQSTLARDAGIKQIIVDPGVGFGKTLIHNIALMRNLARLRSLGYPVLVGPSRKSFLDAILDLPPSERLEGTAAAVALCIESGASVVRVHDVKEMKRVALVADAWKSRG